jgi:O-antigen/teichoic acid export membrane protein
LDDVAHYSVAQRLFIIPPLLLGFVVAPLWPAYQQAKARGDHAWIRRTFRRSLWLATAVAVPYVVVAVLAGPWLISRWVGPEFVVTLGQLLAFAAWCLCCCLGGVVAMLLNGLGVLAPQAVLALVNTAVSVALKIYLTKRLALEGLAWGAALSTLTLVLLPGFWLSARALRQLQTQAPSTSDSAS